MDLTCSIQVAKYVRWSGRRDLNPQHTGSKPAVSAVGLRPDDGLRKSCGWDVHLLLRDFNGSANQRSLNSFLGELSAFWCARLVPTQLLPEGNRFTVYRSCRFATDAYNNRKSNPRALYASYTFITRSLAGYVVVCICTFATYYNWCSERDLNPQLMAFQATVSTDSTI